jgi:glutamyl-tRNA synthetase
MKMDGTSKRKLSKRKDPELALSYYRAEGFPTASVYEYILTILNSNYEDWRRANADLSPSDFKFSYKKMNPAGSLFDEQKLLDVSKNVISKMSADEVYQEVLSWSKEFDPELFSYFAEDTEKAIAILSIGRGGAKPRKDLATWKDIRPYVSLFYRDLFSVKDPIPECVTKEDARCILERYCSLYSVIDDSSAWFDKITKLSVDLGYAAKPKEYKENPCAFKGHVGDVSMVLRIGITGKAASPDLYSVMQILGEDEVKDRMNCFMKSL